MIFSSRFVNNNDDGNNRHEYFNLDNVKMSAFVWCFIVACKSLSRT